MLAAGKTAMHGLNSHQRSWLRERMQERTALLTEEIRAALHRTEAGREGLPNRRLETDDEAVADLQTGLDIAELERDVHELGALLEALRRLPNDDFGLCADCGADIPFARLRVDPQATRCVACQSLAERHGRRNRKD